MPHVEATTPFHAATEDGVTLYWFDTVVADLGFNPDTAADPVPLVPEPWDMSKWDTNPPLTQLIRELAIKASGGVDVTDYLYRQQDLAWYIEQQDRKNWRPADGEPQKVHHSGPEADAAGHAADAGGNRGHDAGRPKDGVEVVEEVPGSSTADEDAGRAQPVPGS